MGRSSITPLIGIIDDTDRPEAKMLVVVYGHPARPRVEYLNPDNGPLMPIGARRHSIPALFTELSKFGCRAIFEEDGTVQVQKVGDSIATYPDGKARSWQDNMVSRVEVRPGLMGQIMKAIRAARAQEPARSEERLKRSAA